MLTIELCELSNSESIDILHLKSDLVSGDFEFSDVSERGMILNHTLASSPGFIQLVKGGDDALCIASVRGNGILLAEYFWLDYPCNVNIFAYGMPCDGAMKTILFTKAPNTRH